MSKKAKISIGIDASRNRSGGAVAHLNGIINAFEMHSDIREVHIWGPTSLLKLLPEKAWLHKHSPSALQKSLIWQIWWQYWTLEKEVRRIGCDILFASDASTLCNFNPLVVLSQDLLSYEPGAMKSYRWSQDRLRLEVIKRIQNRAFRRAAGVLFLTQYAKECVQSSCGNLKKTALAPHGVDEVFRAASLNSDKNFPQFGEEIKCVYVSNTEFYKHQWNVVLAIKTMRDRGFPVTLTLIGGGAGKSQSLLEATISKCDGYSWVTQFDFLKHSELPGKLDDADIFVFASSCENLPVTLLEGMAKGMPIICSNRGPMPEVLEDGGIYFNPLDPLEIADAITKVIQYPDLRRDIRTKALQKSAEYTWNQCSRKTFTFIRDVFMEYACEQ